MKGPSPTNDELHGAGYRIADTDYGFELTLGDKVLCRSVVSGNCAAVARHHFRAALIGETKLFERGLRR